MWKEMARIISEVRPTYAFVENSPMLTTRGLGVVLADLAKMGFDAEWGVLSAADVGALHKRERIWVLAANANIKYVERRSKTKIHGFKKIQSFIYPGVDKSESGLRSVFKSGLCRKFNGIPNQVDRLRAIGNAQVPLCATTAFTLLRERLEK
jgi:DNA (cytosine-5)-methyltransferase 1